MGGVNRCLYYLNIIFKVIKLSLKFLHLSSVTPFKCWKPWSSIFFNFGTLTVCPTNININIAVGFYQSRGRAFFEGCVDWNESDGFCKIYSFNHKEQKNFYCDLSMDKIRQRGLLLMPEEQPHKKNQSCKQKLHIGTFENNDGSVCHISQAASKQQMHFLQSGYHLLLLGHERQKTFPRPLFQWAAEYLMHMEIQWEALLSI